MGLTLSSKLGLSLSGRSLPGWVTRDETVSPALFDADFQNGRYWFNGAAYPDEASWLTAIGASKSSQTYGIGPVVVTGAAELVANGTFDTDTTGWTPTSTGGGTPTIAAVDGALEVTQNGANNGGAAAPITTVLGHAYRVTAKVKNGTDTATSKFLITNKGDGFTAPDSGATSDYHASTFKSQTGYFSGNSGVQILTRCGINGGVGTAYYDDISIKEVKPFQAFTPAILGLTVWGVTPASVPATTQVIFESNSEVTTSQVGCIRILQDTAGAIRAIVRFGNSEAANLNLGVVAPSTAFKVDVALKTNLFVAWLNDGDAVIDTVGTMPGATKLWIGRSGPGEAWGGSVKRVALYSSERPPGNVIRTEGDSYMGGAGGVSLPTTLGTVMARGVINTGQGGSEMGGVRDRVRDLANAYLLRQTTVFWDGSQNGLTTVTAYCDLLAEAIAALGHQRFVVIPCAVPYGQAPGVDSLGVQSEMQARWPNNFLDWRDYIPNTSGTINLDQMLNYPTDSWHLNQTAMNAMAAGISAFVQAKGW